MNLSPASLRVLGSLMEKEMVTPDAYPLSLNAVLAAANQRSSRDPVTDLDEDQIRGALDTLETESLATQARDGGRVPKYEHRIRTVLNLRRDETALLCLLLLRGPQTPGELRSRADRMFQFDDLAQAQATLERLAARDLPLVRPLPRAAGSREVRWQHLLGDPAALPQPEAPSPVLSSAVPGELDQLRDRVAALEVQLHALQIRISTIESSPAPHESAVPVVVKDR